MSEKNPEINVGIPKMEGDKIVFEGGSNAALDEAKAKFNAPGEAEKEAARQAVAKLEWEQKQAQLGHLRGMKEEDLAKMHGYDKAKYATALERLEKDVTRGKAFGNVRADGFGTAVKKNFGKEAWKGAPVKTGLKVAAVLLGAYMALDAFFRSQSKGGENQPPEERSWVTRTGEAAAGLALTSLSIAGRTR